MGWYGGHLHEFDVFGHPYGDAQRRWQSEVLDERKSHSGAVDHHGEGEVSSTFSDFGDSWEHEILVEKILPVEKGSQYPLCLAGKRACPPEDCGGPPGYEDLLKIDSDPSPPGT